MALMDALPGAHASGASNDVMVSSRRWRIGKGLMGPGAFGVVGLYLQT